MEEFKSSNKNHKDDDGVVLPGFRFHPTDEELVGFYLRRKVERKPLRIELISQVDIYKCDPWDLPLPSEYNSPLFHNFTNYIIFHDAWIHNTFIVSMISIEHRITITSISTKWITFLFFKEMVPAN